MKKTAHFEPSFNSLIRCVNSDYFIVLSVSQSLGGVFVIRFYQCTFDEKKNTGPTNSCIPKIT